MNNQLTRSSPRLGGDSDAPRTGLRAEENPYSNEVETLSFEKAFGELEAAVQRLEQGELTLEEAIALYERGMHLAQHCSNALEAAELQVQQLAAIGEQQQQLGMFFEGEGDI